MQTADNASRAAGVGIAYHPFLHDILLECSALFDFVELPLDLYVDTARSALLDPGQRRLSQIAGTKPCVWRGTALSLGTVGPTGADGFPAHLVRSIRALLTMTGSDRYTDSIGFHPAGSGPLQAMPRTEQAARWIAFRQAAAQDALGVPVLLGLPSKAAADGMEVASFLSCVTVHGGGGFVLDATDLAAAALTGGALPGDVVASLPAARVAGLSVSGAAVPGWQMLHALADRIQPASIVLRRDRQLFPQDTIGPDIARARQLVVAPGRQQVRAAPVTAPAPCPEDLALLRQQQSALVGDDVARSVSTQAWQNWRTQVDDLYKAQQIMALMSRGANQGATPPAPWRP